MKDRVGFSIAHFSPSAGDLLRTSRTHGSTERIMNEDIFKVLAERSPSSSSVIKSYKKAVTDLLVQGKAVSVDVELASEAKARNERMISHWTPCKDEEGRARYVVLILTESRDL
jgi:hypothetical protein